MKKSTVYRWLKAVYLAPFMVMFANLDGEVVEASTTEAGDVTGAGESAGAPEQSGEAGTGGETTSQEPQGGTEGTAEASTEQGTSPDSLPAHERIQQLVAKDAEKERKIAELEGKLTTIEQRTAQTAPDFIELDFDAINAHITSTLDQIDALRLEGKGLEALQLEDGIRELRDNIRQNEAKKASYIQRMQQGQQQEQMLAALNSRLNEAAAIVRQDANIPPEVWNEGEKFWQAERQAKPLLAAQYREIAMVQGPIAALLFAKDYVMKNMGAAQQATLQKKEEGKAAVPGGKTTSASMVPAVDLKALHAKALKSGDEDDMLEYMVAKREAAQTKK